MTKEKQPTLSQKGDLTTILSSNGAKPSPMAGFNPEHQDIVDYIVKITHEIWEERGIGRLYKYYGTNIKIHLTDSEILGRDKVIESTIQAMAAFPNRRLYAEDVIWSGNETDGYFSSHRLRHQGDNWGYTEWGNPTGRHVDYRAVADCKIEKGIIVEEWLARDNLLLMHQLGFDAHALAKKAARSEKPLAYTVPSEADRLRGQLPPVEVAPADSKEFDPATFTHTALHQIWNHRLLNLVPTYYAENFKCDSSSGRSFYGQNQMTNYILQFLAPFPDLAISIDQFTALQEDATTYRTATRWVIQGTHKGIGMYGKPSGNPIRLMGMTHNIIKDGKFTEEWTIFDEFALLKQIYANSDEFGYDDIF